MALCLILSLSLGWWAWSSRPVPVLAPTPPVTFGSQPRAEGTGSVEALPVPVVDRPGGDLAAPEPGQLPCASSPAPSHLVVEGLCIHARLVVSPVTADLGGVPDDPHVIGVWDRGAGLSARSGTTLLAGHVNTIRQGAGSLYRLSQLWQGAMVKTADETGVVTEWVVVSMARIPQSQVASAGVYAGPTGPRVLKVVTCGGALVPAEGGTFVFADNVIATAVPLA